MLHERIRNLGITLICAALTLVAWKTIAPNAGAVAAGESGGQTLAPAATGELTIPVEIVVAGEEPRSHEVRIVR